MRFLKIAVLSILAVFVMAADAPKKDDLVELSGWLNARSEAKFRKVDTNTLFTLTKGTRGAIRETKYFPATKNYGVCIRVLSGSRVDNPNDCVWVYYNPRQPNLKLFSVGDNETARNAKLNEWAIDPKNVPTAKVARTPDSANAAEATRDIPAIIEPPSLATGGTDSGKPMDPNLFAQTSIGVLDQLNQNGPLGRDPLDVNSGCPDGNCVMKLASYEQCTNENNYLENKIAEVSKRDPMASVLAMQSNDMITKSCVQKAMEIFPASKNFYRSDACVFARKVPRPCVSESYVDMTAKSFNLVAKCMAPILAGSTDLQDQKQAAYSVFSLMTQESGLHTNASSGTGAGGISQLTKPAIDDVNLNIARFKEALSSSANPLCSKNLASVLDEPIHGAGLSSRRSCNRISMDKNHPLKSMLYGFAFQNIVKDYLQNSVFDRFTGVFSQLPNDLRDGLKLKLAMWGHNAGADGITQPAEQVLTQMRRNSMQLRTAQDVDKFMSELEKTMLNSPSTGNRRAGRPKETSTYYPNIVARMRTLEPVGDQSCIVR